MEKIRIFTPSDFLDIKKFGSIVDSCENMEQLNNCKNIIQNVYDITKNDLLYRAMERLYIKKKHFLLKTK